MPDARGIPVSRCAEHGLRLVIRASCCQSPRLAARRLRLPFHRSPGIAPVRAFGMAFLGFRAPPVYCNGRMLADHGSQAAIVARARILQNPCGFHGFLCPGLRHVQGSTVAHRPLRASPSHLPDVFHPGDTHGIFPFRGLTSSRAGLPLGRPCPSFPWLVPLSCHAREPKLLQARVGQLPTCPPTGPGFRTRIFLQTLPVSRPCVPFVAL